ncbi:MAG: serine/threonine-protein phosphatase [Treponema sp.]|jgi:protein phosphatase|nr:serine/threonine-protein phosphatase [Treponema sp.]
MLEIACVVEAGRRAPKNDDRAAINSKLVSQGSYTESAGETCLAVICDGVGGEAFGNEAADIVTDIFSRLSETPLTIDIINEYIVKANEAVIIAQKTDSKHSKMSTTIAGLYINGDDFIAFNVGDSRIYRYRSYIAQISKDHSVMQEQIDLGLEPKPGHENIITRYIGGKHAIPEIVDGTGRVFYNDVYVLCTDGVWGVLEDNDLEDILSQDSKTEKACQALIDLALQKGSTDNLSAIIVRRVK